MAWGRLYQFLLYLPERSLLLHIQQPRRPTKESCHRNAGTASGSSWKIHELSRNLWTWASRFPESWGEKPQGLSQGDVVNIEYFHIEILIYFYKMKTVSVPWQKKGLFFFFKHFDIARGFVSFSFFGLFKNNTSWSKMAEGRAFAKIFFFNADGCISNPKIFFLLFLQAEKEVTLF